MHIARLYCDDWCAVYVNGVEAEQGHSVPLDHFLRSEQFQQELMKIECVGEFIYVNREFSDDEMDELGNHFPEKLSELPTEMQNFETQVARYE